MFNIAQFPNVLQRTLIRSDDGVAPMSIGANNAQRRISAEPATENSMHPLYIVEDISQRDEHDLILLNRLAQGDVQALQTLYDGYSSVVFCLSLRIVGDQQCAENVLHEVFLRLWSGAEKYDKTLGRVGFWLTEITRRVALSHSPTQRTPQLPQAISSRASVDSHKVLAILAKLPKGQRETLELAYFGGLTCVEIADQTGVPVSSVKSQIRAAMQTIRQLRTASDAKLAVAGSNENREAKTFVIYRWYESYKTAVLETDWIKMQDRLRAAELEIIDRHRVLSEDHGGTAEERKALANATSGLMFLRRDVESWQTAQNQA